MMILLAALFVLSPVVLYLTREKPIAVMIAADVIAYVALLLVMVVVCPPAAALADGASLGSAFAPAAFSNFWIGDVLMMVPVTKFALLLMVCELAGMVVHRNWKASLPRT
ncbi:MAG: hypothetical protein SOR61_07790 [Evtepia sp.]|uniref:hypothetical protein n=1 Tax=Evtepia sp. TaxID=2773933 RepID=UPI002A749BBC|nr:hypothetical protein [Evtepia sp.]MDY3015064.1 hypothetical protein [Evtepia sp.]